MEDLVCRERDIFVQFEIDGQMAMADCATFNIRVQIVLVKIFLETYHMWKIDDLKRLASPFLEYSLNSKYWNQTLRTSHTCINTFKQKNHKR